ncbi:MAG: hypothetical protein KJN63_01050 [Acidimicrobiia bacterium]|nr:hypothetical protein [Acidimicrobiia bacterium]
MYWDWFAAVKFVAATAVVFGLGWMWQMRHEVIDAYSAEERIEALQISPLSLSAATIPPEEMTPPVLATAPDLQAAPLGRLAFVENAVEMPSVIGGESSLSGTVSGLAPDDLGGEVRLTRVTEGGESEISVPIRDSGVWESGPILGGRYRVRALVPSLRASNGSAVVFLSEGEDRSISLSVTTPPQGVVVDVVGPELPVVGARSVIAVTAGRQEVDADGRSVLIPVPGLEVRAEFSPVVTLLSADTVATDSGGSARFLVQCEIPGTSAVTLAYEDQRAVLTVPSCVTPESVEDSRGRDND